MTAQGGWPPPDLSPRPRPPGGAHVAPPEPDASRPYNRLMVAAALVLAGLGAAVLVQALLRAGEPGSASQAGWAVEDRGNSRRLAGDGRHVCSTTADQVLYCVDAETGEELFSRQLDESAVTSPALAAGRVLVAGTDVGERGTLYALTLQGDELWQAPIDAPGDRRMAVVDDVVVAVSGEFVAGELVGIDLTSGAVLWRAYSGADAGEPHVVSSSAFTDGVRVYASIVAENPFVPGGASGHVVAVDPRSGAELWRSPPLPGITPAAGLGAVAFSDGGDAVAVLMPGLPAQEAAMPGQVAVLDAATGEVRWDVPVADRAAGMAHVTGLTVVVDGGEMRAYDGAGSQVWAVAVPGRDAEASRGELSAVLPAAGRLVLAGRDVYAVDPGNGEAELIAESGATSDVVVAGGHLVVAGASALSGVPMDEIRPV
ncbi:MAG TPA: PQQ-binding-like beta-propeller repeat protein [Acidimicrobiales bacterium]